MEQGNVCDAQLATCICFSVFPEFKPVRRCAVCELTSTDVTKAVYWLRRKRKI